MGWHRLYEKEYLIALPYQTNIRRTKVSFLVLRLAEKCSVDILAKSGKLSQIFKRVLKFLWSQKFLCDKNRKAPNIFPWLIAIHKDIFRGLYPPGGLILGWLIFSRLFVLVPSYEDL